jgi:glycosidase
VDEGHADPDWTNYGGKFVPTRHHRVAVQDPYASQQDKDNFTRGWFVDTMPDLNQTNPLVATYLIQNNIWWIEYAGLSGLRIDTYGYSDTGFLTEYTRRLMAEYPKLNMVGEEWHKRRRWCRAGSAGKRNFDGYVSYLPSLMDFPMPKRDARHAGGRSRLHRRLRTAVAGLPVSERGEPGPVRR